MNHLSPRLIVALLFVLLISVFVIQNHDRVTVDILVWDVTLPRSLLIALVFAFGFVAGMITGTWKRRARA